MNLSIKLKAGHLALKVSLIYVIVAVCWVLFSDALMKVLVSNPDQRVVLSMIKSLAFVMVTGGLFYLVLKHWLRKWEQAMERHKQSNTACQEAGERRHQSEDRFRLVLEVSDDGLWDWNLKNGTAYFNPRYGEITGFPTGEMSFCLEYLKRLVHPEDWSGLQESINHHFAGKTAHSSDEFRVTAKNGALKWIWGRGKVVERAPDGTPLRMVGTISDITHRKQIEQALVKSKQHYYDLFEHMNEGAAYCQMIFEDDRPKDFVYLAANRMFTTLTGLKDVVGKCASEVIHDIRARDPELLEIYGRVALTGRPEKFERFVQAMQMWFAVSVFSPEKGNFVAMFDVINDRKQAEESLRESETRYRLLAENATDVIWVLDVVSETFRYFSPSVERLRGYKPEELIQQGITATLSPKSLKYLRSVAPARIEQFRQGKIEFFTDEIEQLHKDGHVICTEATSRLVLNQATGQVEAVGVSRDITERKRLESRMNLLIRALSAAANAIVISDRNGNIEWVNPSFTKLTGYSADEAIGRNPRVLKSGQHSPEFYNDLWRQITAGKVWHGELVNRRKDGQLYTEEMTITPVRDADGQIAHFVAIKQDATERRLLEDRLRQAQKMEAIGQLAGGVAHDFNNILAVIQLQAGLLKGEQELSLEQLDMTTEIEKAAQRAANLTRQLLLFSRKQALQLRDQDLNEIITNIAKMLQRVLGDSIQMHFKIASQPLLIHADAGMMDQVLMNLAVNARDAMPDGGRLVIETSAVEFDDVTAVQFAQARPGSFACVSVTDTGSGIPPEIIPRIFEPFFTTKEAGKGTGLGLATVFGIVQQHLGWINVYSKIGEETTFQVYLPRVAKPSNPEAIWSSLASLPGGTETILLVEDDASVRGSMRNALSRLGYRVREAANGVKALEVWKQHREEIRLLLTDLMMPGGMTGKALAKQLLQHEPKLKVAYVSGYSAEITSKGLQLEEGVNFLTKPFATQALAQTVRKCLDG